MQRSPREKIAEFEDRFGDVRVVERRGRRAIVANNRSTVTHILSRAIGKLVGQKLRLERKKAGMTMLQLAEKAGLVGGKQRICDLENAMNGGAKLGTVYALAAALGIDPFSLLPRKEEVFVDAEVTEVARPRLEPKEIDHGNLRPM